MSDLSLTELRIIAKNRNIKRYKGLSKDELLKNPVKTIKEIIFENYLQKLEELRFKRTSLRINC